MERNAGKGWGVPYLWSTSGSEKDRDQKRGDWALFIARDEEIRKGWGSRESRLPFQDAYLEDPCGKKMVYKCLWSAYEGGEERAYPLLAHVLWSGMRNASNSSWKKICRLHSLRNPLECMRRDVVWLRTKECAHKCWLFVFFQMWMHSCIPLSLFEHFVFSH